MNEESSGVRMKTVVCATDHELHVWIARQIQQETLPTQFCVQNTHEGYEVSYPDKNIGAESPQIA